MKRRTYVIIAFVLLASISLITAVATQGQPRSTASGPRVSLADEPHDRDPVTPAQVIRMSQAQVPESLILQRIRSRKARPLSVEELVDLCRKKVSPEVIAEMQKLRPVEDALSAASATLGRVAVSEAAIQTAMEGYNVQRMRLEIIAHNLANVSTIGFKRSTLNLADNRYDDVTLPGIEDADGNLTPQGVSVGRGVRAIGVGTDFRQGTLDTTNNDLDLAIAGNGFFQLREPGSGETVYTRAGTFSVNKDGTVVLSSADTGRLLEPAISLPNDTIKIGISPQGLVSVLTASNPNVLTQVGQIELANFLNPEGLLKRGGNLYSKTEASGEAISAQPGTDGVGTLQKGALELSNVQVNREIWDLQRTLRLLKAQTILLRAAGFETLGANLPLGPRPAIR